MQLCPPFREPGPLRAARAQPWPGSARRGGFTLLEVVLAVVIVVGMMIVVVYFYQQAADLRAQLIREAERVSAVRLVMDRMTTELRTAHAHPELGAVFQGSAESLQFVRTDVPPRSAWPGGSMGRVEIAQTDLKRVRYSRGGATDGTNMVATGLIRTETPLVEARQVADSRAGAVLPEPAESAGPGPEPLTSDIQYLQFRYWDGRQWSASWNGSGLPRGVEVTLGFDMPVMPVEDATGTNEFGGDLYRRVIYLPGGGAVAGRGSGTNSFEAPLDEAPGSGTEVPL